MSRWEAPVYNRYKGKNNRKAWLAAGLAALLAALLILLALQQCIVYGADGSARLELPWQQEEHTDFDETDVNIIKKPGQEEGITASAEK